MFIVIEGIDGSGKATQVQELKKQLESIGKSVLLLDFPRYGNPAAFFVEKYLNAEYGNDISPKVASYFYALDRYDSYQKNKDLWKNYDYIISNRYTSASMIHQGGKISGEKEKKEFFDWLENLEYQELGLPEPDKIFILDVSPKIATKYVEKKEKRSYIKNNINKDIHENDILHLKNAYDTINIFAANKKNVEKIKCTQNGKLLKKSEITSMLLSKIKK